MGGMHSLKPLFFFNEANPAGVSPLFMEPSSVPEGEGRALLKLGFQPSLSAWLGAVVGGQPTLCAPIQILWCFLPPRVP